MKTQSVREQLLEHTLVLIRRRGFNGFSYRDLAELVGVKTSSIHYYFPTKDDLVLEAVKEYSARLSEHLRAIDTTLPVTEQAAIYLAPFRNSCGSDQICLCGMLSTETLCLPESVHKLLQGFYLMHEKWLTGLLERAQPLRTTPFPVPPPRLAQVVFGSLQSGLIAARLFGTSDRVEAAADTLMAAVTG
ncbi:MULTISPECIES: TetR/AcrR family transcriptional regulator [unclassified Cupriavidus]|uniref:TetR/AcrR family transcriptional regulator n=1 Tax=unclassified Cupriavidus TaxID=2640874 RepID=UPI00040891F9|nr:MULTISPECIES: TetR/AcrR family transcriptional regulator [unclassified Cupriavidus]MBP0632207.1 TetR/AcrR family transcriptional regulator [Cupriavidus sp. AcVe19-1a]MBP0638087.1 TetR/AcrR family transcriptional regulator [Cupriavidus sp. AcVe19-6a]